MYQANLSYDQLNEYLDFLVGSGLISKMPEENYEGAYLYKATEKGREFLRIYSSLQKILSHSNEMFEDD